MSLNILKDLKAAYTNLNAAAVRETAEQHLTIGPTKGAFTGQVAERSFELHIIAKTRPASVSVDGRDVGAVAWDAERSLATVTLPSHPIGDRIEVTWH